MNHYQTIGDQLQATLMLKVSGAASSNSEAKHLN